MDQKGEATDNERNSPSSQIEDIFDSHDAVESTFSDPDKVPIVGIDLGEVVTAAACCIQFSDHQMPGVIWA